MILPIALLAAAAAVQAININTYVFREGAPHNCHGSEEFVVGYSVVGQCTEENSVYYITDCTTRNEYASSTCSDTPTATDDISSECHSVSAQNEYTYSCKDFAEPIQIALREGDCDNANVGASVDIIVEFGECTRLPYIVVTTGVYARSIKVVQNAEDEYEAAYYSDVDCTTLLDQFPSVLDGECAYDSALPNWKSIRASKIQEVTTSPTTQAPAVATREPSVATQSPSSAVDTGANSMLLAGTATIVVVVGLGM